MKKLTTILLFFSLTFIFGCHQKLSSKIKNSERQTLKVNIQGDIASLHPHTGVDLFCRIFQKALFEGLTRIGSDGEPCLAGAEKVEISPCQKIYTFTLKPMRWTNGEKVTAYHFEKSWKKAVSPNSNCLRTDVFYVIKNAEKVQKKELPIEDLKVCAKDEKTLVVELEHPTPYFLELVANPIFSPLYDDDENPNVFNGPFKIILWIHDTQIILEKNPNYWDAASVKLARIEVSQVTDASTALLMYEKNELDWIGNPLTSLPLDALAKIEQSNEYNSQAVAAIYWVSLNTELFPLNSASIRKALSTALDRTNIAKHVLVDETPAKSVVPLSISLLQKNELYPDDNSELANRYFEKGMEELGISSLKEFPRLILDHSDVPGQKKLAEAIQQTWQSVLGIKVELRCSEWKVFVSNLHRKQFQMGGCVWFPLFVDPIYSLDIFRNSDHYYNVTGWENPYFTKLLALADEDTDPRMRSLHLKQAEAILLDEMPIIPLYEYQSKYLKSPNLKNLILDECGHVDFKWAYFE